MNEIDLSLSQIRIWNGKGFKHCIVTLAPVLTMAMTRQIEWVKLQLGYDQANDSFRCVWMPDALERKYRSANKELGWRYLFPSYIS